MGGHCTDVINKIYDVLESYNVEAVDYVKIIDAFRDEDCDTFRETKMYLEALCDDDFLLEELDYHTRETFYTLESFCATVAMIFPGLKTKTCYLFILNGRGKQG